MRPRVNVAPTTQETPAKRKIQGAEAEGCEPKKRPVLDVAEVTSFRAFSGGLVAVQGSQPR